MNKKAAKTAGVLPASSVPASSTPALNVVDSCGWLEYLAGGKNASFFEAALLDTAHLIVPSLCIYEVGKHMIRHSGMAAAEEVLQFMRQGRIVALTDEQLLQAAQTSHAHQLAMADAIIWQTAQILHARLLTQDAGLKDMPAVQYTVKT
ncbi:MAG: type II toxin-antitoxin system VapC family toxin [Burkholderiales bacterium]|nr:MAG: type II toxin-antitoxin system VapC family toxin [Burkholderiales bacterium]